MDDMSHVYHDSAEAISGRCFSSSTVPATCLVWVKLWSLASKLALYPALLWLMPIADGPCPSRDMMDVHYVN